MLFPDMSYSGKPWFIWLTLIMLSRHHTSAEAFPLVRLLFMVHNNALSPMVGAAEGFSMFQSSDPSDKLTP
jgi:hypothetical protein